MTEQEAWDTLKRMETITCPNCRGSGGYVVERLLGDSFLKCNNCNGTGRSVAEEDKVLYEQCVVAINVAKTDNEVSDKT
jgi:uncharacterized phage protein